MRMGVLLEDLDTFAGDIAARHAGLQDKVIVTGYVDRISWFASEGTSGLELSKDLQLSGMVYC